MMLNPEIGHMQRELDKAPSLESTERTHITDRIDVNASKSMI